MKQSLFKKYPKLSLLFFNIFLLLFILIIFEILLRIFTPNWLSYRMKMINSGNLAGYGTDANWNLKYKDGSFFSFTPNSKFKIYHFEYENTVTINALGGRSNEPGEKTDTTNIIPFTGDSFVMGVGVEDTETVVSLTKKTTGYNFLNLGIAGSCMPIQRKIINMRYEELGKPKIVIYGFWLGNDFDDIMKQNSITSPDSVSLITNPKEIKQPADNGIMWKVNFFINNNKFLRKLYVLQFIKQKIINMQNIKNKEMYTPFYLFDSSNTEYINKAKIQIDKEVEILSKEPYKSIVIIIPDKYQINDSLRKSMVNYYSLNEKNINPLIPNQIITETLKKYNIRYIDATQCLKNHQYEQALYYVLDNHFTRFGQKILSECISDSLKKTIAEYKMRK